MSNRKDEIRTGSRQKRYNNPSTPTWGFSAPLHEK